MSDISVAEVSTPAPSAPVAEAPAVQTPTNDHPPSLDDTLAATMAEIKARRPEQGADGKFIPKAGAVDATPKVEVPGSPQAAAPEPALPAIEAPQSLPDDVKKLWNELPRTAQETWSRRESETHKKITADGERLKSLTAIDEALTPSLDFIQQNQIPKPEYVRRLAAADHALRTNGPAAIAEIARMYGIPLQGGQPIGQPQDPQYNALAQRLGAIERESQQKIEAERAARLSESEKKIEAFKKDAPHFDKVEELMTKLYEPGMELKDLYDMAAKAHPEVSKLLAAEADAKAKADALAKQKEEAAKAEKLRTLGSKPGAASTAAKAGGSWEDTMRATHRAMTARR